MFWNSMEISSSTDGDVDCPKVQNALEPPNQWWFPAPRQAFLSDDLFGYGYPVDFVQLNGWNHFGYQLWMAFLSEIDPPPLPGCWREHNRWLPSPELECFFVLHPIILRAITFLMSHTCRRKLLPWPGGCCWVGPRGERMVASWLGVFWLKSPVAKLRNHSFVWVPGAWPISCCNSPDNQ